MKIHNRKGKRALQANFSGEVVKARIPVPEIYRSANVLKKSPPRLCTATTLSSYESSEMGSSGSEGSFLGP